MSAGIEAPLATQGQQWLQHLLAQSGFAANVKEGALPGFEQLEGVWLTIQASDLSEQQVQLLLADSGHALDAFQYLLNINLNLGKDKDHHTSFTIELADHRRQRLQELQALADQVAAEVRATQREAEMPPLSAAERRLVHTLFKAVPDLETFSRGQEPDRRLVVQPRTQGES
jgi:spoIIIJ-associated protein